MPDREKLIEICRRYDGTPPCDTCKTPIGNCSMCGLERLIDYLIDNGVTVRERGRWKKTYTCHGEQLWGYECNQCKADNPRASYFCPNCGADMR